MPPPIEMASAARTSVSQGPARWVRMRCAVDYAFGHLASQALFTAPSSAAYCGGPPCLFGRRF
jgi:hypothetical protein